MALSLVIHSIFCVQAVAATRAGTGGMAEDETLFLVFLPHYIAIYFLPPKWPIANGGEVDWWRVAGKLAVSYPASFIYGWIVGTVWYLFHRLMCRFDKRNSG